METKGQQYWYEGEELIIKVPGSGQPNSLTDTGAIESHWLLAQRVLLAVLVFISCWVGGVFDAITGWGVKFLGAFCFLLHCIAIYSFFSVKEEPEAFRAWNKSQSFSVRCIMTVYLLCVPLLGLSGGGFFIIKGSGLYDNWHADKIMEVIMTTQHAYFKGADHVAVDFMSKDFVIRHGLSEFATEKEAIILARQLTRYQYHWEPGSQVITLTMKGLLDCSKTARRMNKLFAQYTTSFDATCDEQTVITKYDVSKYQS